MHPQPNCQEPTEGQHVLFADGDDLGVVIRVEQTDQPDLPPMLVVQRAETDGPDAMDQLVIPSQAIHVVTDQDIILGTTAAWIAHQQGLDPPHVNSGQAT